MYCLRYFLPILLFFPFPSAPPFLVFLFLISLSIQHRPCAYCSLLLSAILVSTCSWNIASLDVSQLYHPHPANISQPDHPPPSLLADLASFFAPSPSPSQATLPYELKSLRRCWCYSNIGRSFDAIWAPTHFAPPPVTPNSPDPAPAQPPAETAEPDADQVELDQSLRKPKRQLKTLLSPLWHPLLRLSAPKHPPFQPTPLPEPSPAPATPPASPRYRSSFSRHPLIYTHSIRPLADLLMPHLPLPALKRTLVILSRNMPNLPQTLSTPIDLLAHRFHRARSWSTRHIHLNQPIELKWNDLIGIKIVLGSPPPLTSRKS